MPVFPHPGGSGQRTCGYLRQHGSNDGGDDGGGDPGDKVVIFSPFYENYGADTILSGAEPIYVPLTPPEFKFDADVLEAAFKQGARIMILCNPSNPCGKVFTKEELEMIADLAKRYDAYIITDEVYEHIVYEPNRHTYLAALPGMRERTIVCNSLSKTYSITGWAAGVCDGVAGDYGQGKKSS